MKRKREPHEGRIYIDGIAYKYCKKCNTYKIMNETKFFRDRSHKYGFAFYCKDCKKGIQKDYVKNNRAKYNKYIRFYQKTSETWKIYRRSYDKSEHKVNYRKKFDTAHYKDGHNISDEKLLTNRNMDIYFERNRHPFTKEKIIPEFEIKTLKELSKKYEVSDSYIAQVCKRVCLRLEKINL